MADLKVPTTGELLEKSAATPEFKDAVRQLDQAHRSNDLIHFSYRNPPVKVLRVLCGLLEHDPGLEIRNVAIEGRSGCSDYEGTISVNDGEEEFAFRWDCNWKAREQGMTDFMGYPDQITAARTFGYQCFQKFEKV